MCAASPVTDREEDDILKQINKQRKLIKRITCPILWTNLQTCVRQINNENNIIRILFTESHGSKKKK